MPEFAPFDDAEGPGVVLGAGVGAVRDIRAPPFAASATVVKSGMVPKPVCGVSGTGVTGTMTLSTAAAESVAKTFFAVFII